MSNILNLFATDPAFSLTNMTQAIIDLPFTPTKLGKMGLFTSTGIDSTTVLIERTKEVLTLVPAAPRGAPGVVKGLQRRNVRSLQTTHLPQRVSVLADEVQNLRAFGKQTETELLMGRLKKKLTVARRDLDVTQEWQRMGALKGQVIDADGVTVLTDMFAEFGVTQQTLDFGLDSDSTKVLQKCVALSRMVEDAVGGLSMSGLRVECSAEFIDALANHPMVYDAWKYYMAQKNQADYRAGDNGQGGFEFGNIVFSEYRGSIGSQRFIPAGKAYAFPLGVPDMFTTYYAPAPYMDTVNTEGLPYYAAQESLDFNKGVDVETQSNPLHINNRPQAVIELSI